MKGYNYYIVTLDNKKLEGEATSGSVTYSPVMCGDCLVPLSDCTHG